MPRLKRDFDIGRQCQIETPGKVKAWFDINVGFLLLTVEAKLANMLVNRWKSRNGIDSLDECCDNCWMVGRSSISSPAGPSAFTNGYHVMRGDGLSRRGMISGSHEGVMRIYDSDGGI